MVKRSVLLAFVLCGLATLSSEAPGQSWRHFTSTDEMTGEEQAFAVSPHVRSTRPMTPPYTGVRGWLGFGCDGWSEWAFVGFSEAPNLINTRARQGGYSTFTARIRWDSELRRVGMRQEWGERFLQFDSDADVIIRLEEGNSVLLELEWYGGEAYFRFPLAGSARAINQARAACGSTVPSARERRERSDEEEQVAASEMVQVGDEVRLGTCDLRSFVPLHAEPNGSVTEARIGRSNLCGSSALEAKVLGISELDEQTWVQVQIPYYDLEGWISAEFVDPERD